jgi:hypothetical protein
MENDPETGMPRITFSFKPAGDPLFPTVFNRDIPFQIAKDKMVRLPV